MMYNRNIGKYPPIAHSRFFARFSVTEKNSISPTYIAHQVGDGGVFHDIACITLMHAWPYVQIVDLAFNPLPDSVTIKTQEGKR